MGILNLILEGNLTKDATFNVLKDKGKGVFNFSVAHNLPTSNEENKVLYVECSYWVNYKEGEENKMHKFLEETLKKGKRIVIQSEYFELKKFETNGNEVYPKLHITVNKISIS